MNITALQEVKSYGLQWSYS